MSIVTPQDFGAAANGIADDTQAILAAQAAISAAGGGVLGYDGIYQITSPIFGLSNVHHVGLSRGTRIFNSTPVNSAATFKSECFYFGDNVINYINGYPSFPLQPVNEGDGILTFVNYGDTSNFSPKEIAILASTETESMEGCVVPTTQEFVKIISIGNGTVTLDLGISANTLSASGAARLLKFSGTDGFTGQPFHCVDNVAVSDLNLQGGSISICAMYRSAIRRVNISAARDLFSLNGLGRSLIEDITGQFADIPLELKLGSHDSVIRRINATFVSMSGVTPGGAMVSIGELSRNLSFHDINIYASGWAPSNPVLVGLQYCKNLEIRRLNINAPSVTSGISLLAFPGLNPTTEFIGSVLDCVSLSAGGLTGYVSWGSGAYAPNGNILKNMKFYGSVARNSTATGNNTWSNIYCQNGTITT